MNFLENKEPRRAGTFQSLTESKKVVAMLGKVGGGVGADRREGR